MEFKERSAPKVVNDVLDLGRQVASSRFAVVPPSLIPVKDLYSCVAAAIEDLGTIKYLKLHANNLADEDMPYVADFVTKLSQCKIVDLSCNRFYGLRPSTQDRR